ncbi:MAG: glycoside hydrolase family 95 protein [Luteolibacter sp.]
MKLIHFQSVVLAITTGTGIAAAGPVIRQDQPAGDWQSECLPIGNGRLGAMTFGGIEKEHIQFNEDSVWIGDEEDTGSYQAFGDLLIDLEKPSGGKPEAYRRELDIGSAIHTITYQQGGTTYRRESFASHPANLLVFRFSADRPGAYTGTVSLNDAHGGTVRADGNKLVFSGTLSGKHSLSGGKDKPRENYKIRLDYEARALVLHQSGSLESGPESIRFKECDSLIILLDGGTDYLNRHDKAWKQAHPRERIQGRLAKAARQSYDQLRRAHIADHRALFDRITLDLGDSPEGAETTPTPARLDAYRGATLKHGKGMFYEKDALNLAGGRSDPGLEALIFQYARYLMIASSRPGTLPANLQGIWNHSNDPPWRCDYHTDVNVQMNYWFTGPANLTECFTPLSEWLWSVVPVKREATREKYGVRGWVHRSENGIFGGQSYRWVPGDAPWLLQNIWDHYAFTLDRGYLENRAYPLLKEQCEFWVDSLIEWPDGTLVSPKSVSPEHGPEAEGNSYEQQLVYDLFTNFIEASTLLDRDAEFRKKIAAMRSRLLGPRIGRWGQLQEWAEDRDDPNNKHRHLSHLLAVHPCRQISPVTTPELAEAARVSLNARGDGGTGWSKAWKISMWARLHDGNRAYKLLKEQIHGNFYGNLLSFHPPFQIDGNFGYAAGVCEMLVQSHAGTIHLLPALPDAWPEGRVTGLRARGGFEIDMAWRDGELAEVSVRSLHGRPLSLLYRDKTLNLPTEPGAGHTFGPMLELKKPCLRHGLRDSGIR